MVVLFSQGCGSMSAKKTTMVSYESAGAVLDNALPVLKGFCANGTLNSADCASAKNAYNDAVSVYKLLGTAAIVAIDTGDNTSYLAMQARLSELLTQLTKFTGG
jgi:hypothetical protein